MNFPYYWGSTEIRTGRKQNALSGVCHSIIPLLFPGRDELIAGPEIFSDTGFSSPLAGRMETLELIRSMSYELAIMLQILSPKIRMESFEGL